MSITRMFDSALSIWSWSPQKDSRSETLFEVGTPWNLQSATKGYSSLAQAKGRSEGRQADETEAYCSRKGYKIGETFIDRGFSAYTGENSDKGDLKAVLDMAAAGKIKTGTHLVVESLDRISRQEITAASSLSSTSSTSVSGSIPHLTSRFIRKSAATPIRSPPCRTIISEIDASQLMKRIADMEATIARKQKAMELNTAELVDLPTGPLRDAVKLRLPLPPQRSSTIKLSLKSPAMRPG